MTNTNIKNVEEALDHPEIFRVSIFGSARTKPGSREYDQTYDLALECGKHDIGIVTGGGPGQMEAANAGVRSSGSAVNSIGLTVELPWEGEHNDHLDLDKHFDKFGNRLDHFMALSSAVVISPGGIGTCLEFFYTLQLTQVHHICPIPIILIDPMWHELYDWIQETPVKRGFVSPSDLDNVFCVRTQEEALDIILQTKKAFDAGGGEVCVNAKMYKVSKSGMDNYKGK